MTTDNDESSQDAQAAPAEDTPAPAVAETPAEPAAAAPASDAAASEDESPSVEELLARSDAAAAESGDTPRRPARPPRTT